MRRRRSASQRHVRKVGQRRQGVDRKVSNVGLGNVVAAIGVDRVGPDAALDVAGLVTN